VKIGCGYGGGFKNTVKMINKGIVSSWRYSLFVVYISMFVVLLSSCNGLDPNLSGNYKRVVLVYMAGNTNDGIGNDLLINLVDMEKGYLPTTSDKANVLLAYVHTKGKVPMLIRYSKNREYAVVKDTLFKYEETQSSTDPDVLRKVLEKTKADFPADEYGLIMSSHGTGWLPDNYPTRSLGTYSVDPYGHLVRTFGIDLNNNKGMDIKDLKDAIPYKLSFLMFDCCYMGGIEVAYELREKTDYIIASPTEILIKGFPFDKIMRPFFESTPDLGKVCEEYYTFYNSYSYQAATVVLVKSDKLKALADVCNTIFENNRAKIRSVDRDAIQKYYRVERAEKYFWDLDHFIETISSSSEYASFKAALAAAIPVKYTTSSFLSLPINRFCGVSSYIPAENPESIEAMYKGLDWNIDSGMIK